VVVVDAAEDHDALERTFDRCGVAGRPAVAKDMARLEDKAGDFDEDSWSNLFGNAQYKKR